MNGTENVPIVVAGAGIAGISAAEAARARSPGTPVVLLSGEPDLPYYRLRLLELLDGAADPASLRIHPHEWYARQGIDLRLSSPVASVDPEAHRVVLATGESLPYSALVLASGSLGIVPPVEGAALPGVIPLWTLADARALRAAVPSARRAVVAGGGLLGLEGAYRLSLLGLEVTIVEMLPRLLPNQLDADGSRVFEAKVRSLGIGVRTGAPIARLDGTGRVRSATLRSGEVLDADLVLVATGVRPNLGLLDGSGIPVGRRIAVDASMRTGATDVFAAGDAAEVDGRWDGLWTAAKAQGRVAGMNAAGGSERVAPTVDPYFLSTMDTRVVSIGALDGEGPLGSAIRRDDANHVYRKLAFRGGRLAGAVLVGDADGMARVVAAVKAAVTREEALSSGLLG